MQGLAEPRMVEFSYDDTARLEAKERLAPQIVPLFKEWVAGANQEYRDRLERKAAAKYRDRLAALAEERARAEEKARVTQALADLI